MLVLPGFMETMFYIHKITEKAYYANIISRYSVFKLQMLQIIFQNTLPLYRFVEHRSGLSGIKTPW